VEQCYYNINIILYYIKISIFVTQKSNHLTLWVESVYCWEASAAGNSLLGGAQAQWRAIMYKHEAA